jgi:hypothetical protein
VVSCVESWLFISSLQLSYVLRTTPFLSNSISACGANNSEFLFHQRPRAPFLSEFAVLVVLFSILFLELKFVAVGHRRISIGHCAGQDRSAHKTCWDLRGGSFHPDDDMRAGEPLVCFCSCV